MPTSSLFREQTLDLVTGVSLSRTRIWKSTRLTAPDVKFGHFKRLLKAFLFPSVFWRPVLVATRQQFISVSPFTAYLALSGMTLLYTDISGLSLPMGPFTPWWGPFTPMRPPVRRFKGGLRRLWE